MNAYVLTHSAAPQTVYDMLNGSRAVMTWVSPFPYAALVLSNLTLPELSAVVHTHLGDTWFIVMEATQQNTQGWLPVHFWDYINDPQGTWSKQLFSKLPPPWLKPRADITHRDTSPGLTELLKLLETRKGQDEKK